MVRVWKLCLAFPLPYQGSSLHWHGSAVWRRNRQGGEIAFIYYGLWWDQRIWKAKINQNEDYKYWIIKILQWTSCSEFFFFFFLRGGYRLLTLITQNAKVFFFFLNLFTYSSGIFHNLYANIGHTLVFLIVWDAQMYCFVQQRNFIYLFLSLYIYKEREIERIKSNLIC